MRFDLSDEDWTLLESPLPRNRKSARVDDRKIMNAIFYAAHGNALARLAGLRSLHNGL